MSEEPKEGPGPAEAFAALTDKVERVLWMLEAGAQGVDYTPTLAAIEKGQRATVARLDKIEQHPSLELSPEAWVSRMEQAVAAARRAVEQDLRRAETALSQAADQMEDMRRQARTVKAQNRRVLQVGGGALIAGLVLWAALAGPIARRLPASWAAPEKMAAAVMAEPRALAGQDMIASASPQGWAETVKAIKLYRANRDALAGCGLAATRAGKVQRCSVKVEPSPEGEK